MTAGRASRAQRVRRRSLHVGLAAFCRRDKVSPEYASRGYDAICTTHLLGSSMESIWFQARPAKAMRKMIVPASRADSLEDRTPPTNIIAACSVGSRRWREGSLCLCRGAKTKLSAVGSGTQAGEKEGSREWSLGFGSERRSARPPAKGKKKRRTVSKKKQGSNVGKETEAVTTQKAGGEGEQQQSQEKSASERLAAQTAAQGLGDESVAKQEKEKRSMEKGARHLILAPGVSGLGCSQLAPDAGLGVLAMMGSGAFAAAFGGGWSLTLEPWTRLRLGALLLG